VFSACLTALKCRPVLHHCVDIFFWSSGIMDCMFCLHLKIEFRSCARGRQWCGIFHYDWWTALIKRGFYFPHADYASWGLYQVLVYMFPKNLIFTHILSIPRKGMFQFSLLPSLNLLNQLNNIRHELFYFVMIHAIYVKRSLNIHKVLVFYLSY